ncbi:hypothetical protein FQZ97_624800 [compost metagenome]
MESMWKREFRKRQRNLERKERTNRNWPLHRDTALRIFGEFKQLARKDGVHFEVDGGVPVIPGTDRLLGESNIVLSVPAIATGIGRISYANGGESITREIEKGCRLTIHHSEPEGLIEAFLSMPRRDPPLPNSEILIFHTYNSDELTADRVKSLIRQFLVFHRVTSRLQRGGLAERYKVRWWRFIDVRNRRGIGQREHHFLTKWELIVLGALAAIVGSSLISSAWTWLSGLLKSLTLQ